MTEIYVLGATVILMACVVVAITRRNAVLSNEYMELLYKVTELIDRYEKTDKTSKELVERYTQTINTYHDMEKQYERLRNNTIRVIDLNDNLIKEIKGHKDDGR